MSEHQRGYNAGVMEILKLIADSSNKNVLYEIDRIVKGWTNTEGPTLTTFEAGRRKAFHDFLSAPKPQNYYADR